MPTKPLDRLMFVQGNCCFFCDQPLPKEHASVEHLLASCHGGANAIASLLKGQPESEATRIVERMKSEGIIEVSDTKVAYKF